MPTYNETILWSCDWLLSFAQEKIDSVLFADALCEQASNYKMTLKCTFKGVMRVSVGILYVLEGMI